MKNLQQRLLLLIIVLALASGYVVWKYPTHEGLDIQGGMRVVLRAEKEKLPKGSTWDDSKLDMITGIIRNRVDALGVAEPVVYPMPGQDRIIVELPGVKDKKAALDTVQSTAKMEFCNVPQLDNGEWRDEPVTLPNGNKAEYDQIMNVSTGKPVSDDELKAKILDNPNAVILTGADLKPNSNAELLSTGKTIIHFEFQDNKKSVFEDFTRTHINKRLAVFLDNKLITAPNINDVIPGVGIIEGNFTPESAKILANQLNAGALPVPLEQLQLSNIEATLGAQAVHKTMIAGAVGLALVLVFMLVWYKVPGLLADVALVLYALFVFALFKIIPVTLTVPGIAGFILSIGMAVDANILIFERMKEERRTGKSLRASIEAGFRRAITAIVDSNACTLITCGVLYNFGTGQVRGFALTLAIGVAVSFFTAVTVSRTLLLLFAGSQAGQNDNLYSLAGGFHPKLQVTKRMGFWFGLSGLIIIPGLIAWLGLGGIKKSIEFTGGTEVTATFAQRPNPAQINAAMAALGYKESRVVVAEGNQAFITIRRVETDADRQRVTSAIKALGTTEEPSVSTVRGTISAELARNAFLAVIYASALIILYLALRFSLPNFIEGLKFGTCAVIALLHDVLVLWGSFAILGYLFNWQIDSLFVTGMLTVIGFSVHDTIIIFDRMRENLKYRQRGETFAEVADRSIEQTFARSVYTSFTVILTLLALLIFGGSVIRSFIVALLIGIISGTYSSIFNATPLLVLWRRLTGDVSLSATPATAGPSGAAPRMTARPSAPRPAAPKPTARKVEPVARPTATAAPIADGIEDEEREAATAGARVQPKKRKRRM